MNILVSRVFCFQGWSSESSCNSPALKLSDEVGRIAASGEARENFTFRIEYLLLIIMGLLLIALASCYIFFRCVFDLGRVKDAGFRSGAPSYLKK